MVVDLFLVYQFVRRLATPFEKWDAFKLGIIDAEGKVLKKRKTLKTKKEEQAWGLYDIMLANIKKLLAKVPGGSSKFASYAAALFLIKEYKHFTDESLITEDCTESDIDRILLEFQNGYVYYNTLAENVNGFIKLNKEDVSAGSGAIAGIGIGPDGEPGVPPKARKKYKNKNKSKLLSFKETLK
jgi:hypothetical protein